MLQCRPLETAHDALLLLSFHSDNTCQQYYRANVIIIPQSVLRQVHSLFQSEFFTEYDLSIYSTPLFPLRSFGCCQPLQPRIPVTSILPSIFPSKTCFRRQFLQKMWPVLQSSLFLLYVEYSSPLWLFVTPLHVLHDWYSWSPSFYSTKFQNFPGISDLLSEIAKFQHHTKLCTECCILMVSS